MSIWTCFGKTSTENHLLRSNHLSSQSNTCQSVLFSLRTHTLLWTEFSSITSHTQRFPLSTLRWNLRHQFSAILSQSTMDSSHSSYTRSSIESIFHSGKHRTSSSSRLAQSFDLAVIILRLLSFNIESPCRIVMLWWSTLLSWLVECNRFVRILESLEYECAWFL